MAVFADQSSLILASVVVYNYADKPGCFITSSEYISFYCNLIPKPVTIKNCPKGWNKVSTQSYH